MNLLVHRRLLMASKMVCIGAQPTWRLLLLLLLLLLHPCMHALRAFSSGAGAGCLLLLSHSCGSRAADLCLRHSIAWLTRG
jgi:hypothetical protein